MRHEQPRVHGTRDELTTELQRLSVGWMHFGKPSLAQQAHDGARLLSTSSTTAIQVGHTTFTVTD